MVNGAGKKQFLIHQMNDGWLDCFFALHTVNLVEGGKKEERGKGSENSEKIRAPRRNLKVTERSTFAQVSTGTIPDRGVLVLQQVQPCGVTGWIGPQRRVMAHLDFFLFWNWP